MKRLCLLAVLPAVALAVFDSPSVELNAWTCTFSNYGTWGYATGAGGGLWRGGLFVYGAGIWVGCKTGAGDTLVTVGYNANSGGSEMFPTLTQNWREGSGDTRDHVYVYPADWPAPPDRFPMAPTVADADVEVWSVACDSSPDQHQSPGRPIGFDLCTTVLADTAGADSDFFFLRCAISNPSDDTFYGLHVGICCDPDIGVAADDRAGLILNKVFGTAPDTFRVRNTGFAWSQDPDPPGAVAIRYLSGPLGDTITAFKLFTLENDPANDTQQYMMLAGYDCGTGEYDPFDSVDLAAADKRFLIAAGPFTLSPSDTAVCWFAVLGADFTPSDTSALAATADAAYRRWQRMLGVAEAPEATPTAAFRVRPSVVRAGEAVVLSGLHDSEPVWVYDAAGRLRRTSTGRLVTDGLERGVYLVRTRARTAKLVIE